MPQSTPPELPANYYLKNFNILLRQIVEQYWDLLSEYERHFCQGFIELEEDPQKLLVRMLTRKGSLFRADKLNYCEIHSIPQAAEQLANAGLIEVNPAVDIEELLGVFSKPEWLQMLSNHAYFASQLSQLKKAKRADFNSALQNTNIPLQQLIPVNLYQLCHPEIFDVFKLLFFGNLRQDLTDFVLRDLGLYRFETYQIDRAFRIFSNREQIVKHLTYYQLMQQWDKLAQNNLQDLLAFFQALPEADSDDKLLGRRLDRIYLTLARQLERIHELDHALAIYARCKRHPARERTARILTKQGDHVNALGLCQDILTAPLNQEEEDFARIFGKKLATSQQRQWPQIVNYRPPTTSLLINRTDHRVEIAVKNYLSAQGQCFYVENSLFLSVFGLHFWDVLFAPVKGAFSHGFQIAPHDLYEDDFLESRQTLYQYKLSMLAQINNLKKEYLALMKDKSGTLSAFVDWEAINEPLIEIALQRIPASHWQLIFTRLWQDLKANRSGFPDLVYFPNAGAYELIEVKGPGDKLQKNQLRWMHYFAKHHIPHRVINVEWCSTNGGCKKTVKT